MEAHCYLNSGLERKVHHQQKRVFCEIVYCYTSLSIAGGILNWIYRTPQSRSHLRVIKLIFDYTYNYRLLLKNQFCVVTAKSVFVEFRCVKEVLMYEGLFFDRP